MNHVENDERLAFCRILWQDVFMDLLADILKHAGLKGRILNQQAFTEVTVMKFPCDKSIGFHVVTQGEGFIHRGPKGKVLRLQKGDIALMARGHDHILTTEEKLTAAQISKSVAPERERVAAVSGKKSKMTTVSGAYQLWNNPVHAFFAELPDWYILKSEDIQNYDHLQMLIRLLSEEVANPTIGTERIIQSLLDIIFSQIIRKIVAATSTKPETWSHAIQDQQIRESLEMMHADCAKDWTIEELGKRVGLSRAGFAQKFKRTLGDTPLHYLTSLRIQKSMELLISSDDNIEKVAEAVGYKDAFSFSKVFKKITGTPPRDFRTKNREEADLAWRF